MVSWFHGCGGVYEIGFIDHEITETNAFYWCLELDPRQAFFFKRKQLQVRVRALLVLQQQGFFKPI